MEEDKKSPTTPLATEALLVLGITGVAYWLTFQYEVAFLKHFGVPPHLAEISVQTVLLVALGLSSATLTLFLVANFIAMMWPKNFRFRRKLAFSLMLLVIPVWYLLNYDFNPKYWLAYLIVPIYLLLFEVLWPILVYRNKGSIRERLLADQENQHEVLGRNIGSRLYRAFGPVAYYLFAAFVMGSFLASIAGRARAATQQEYFVLLDAPNVVVLRVYGDKIIGAEVNRENKTVSGNLLIRGIGTEKVRLRREPELGPFAERKP